MLPMPSQRRRSAARPAGTIRVDWERGERHLFWCRRGIELGLRLETNTADNQDRTNQCPDCWRNWRRKVAGESRIYLIWRHPGSKDVYVGEAVDPEHRYYTHFLYGNVVFLPTIEEYEDLAKQGKPLPYYEVVDTVSTTDGTHKRREREVADGLRRRGFNVSGGR